MPAVRELTVAAVNRVPGPLAAPFRSGGLLARAAAPLLEPVLPTGVIEDLELDVLQGAGRILDEHRPSVIVESSAPSIDGWPHWESYEARRLGDRHWLLRSTFS
jgi:hypothetical protein